MIFFLSSEILFRLPEIRIPWQSTGGVDRCTCRTPHFHMYSRCTVQTTCVPWLKEPEGSRRIVSQKTFTHPRIMFHLAPHNTLNTSTSSLSPTSPVLLSSASPNPDLLSTHPFIHCEDPRQEGSTEFHSSKGHEPKRIELNRILVNPQNQIIDDHDDIEEIGVKSLIHSVYDSAESIATPPDSELEDEQLRKMLASRLHFQERDENEGQTQAYHSERESLMINSSPNPEISRKPEAVFSCHSESNQNTFSERDRSNEQ